MQRGICLLSVVPCRKEPAGTSEMVTQLLFGEHYSIIEQKEDWLKITTALDNYECWLSAKQHSKLSEQAFQHLQSTASFYSCDLISLITDTGVNRQFPLTMGAVLPGIKNGSLKIDQHHFSFDGNSVAAKTKAGVDKIIATAYSLLNAPYLWGGRTAFGIDCSGFTQLVYRLNGYQLPRDAYQQVELGLPLSFVEEAQAGDIAFFDNEEGKIVHVGILLDNQQIIHASGCVRIDKYDHYGIFNGDTGKYSHSMRVIKRIL
jgi:hypothetical protein